MRMCRGHSGCYGTFWFRRYFIIGTTHGPMRPHISMPREISEPFSVSGIGSSEPALFPHPTGQITLESKTLPRPFQNSFSIRFAFAPQPFDQHSYLGNIDRLPRYEFGPSESIRGLKFSAFEFE